jgi:hypothetical protein
MELCFGCGRRVGVSENQSESEVSNNPFDEKTPPVRLRLKGRKLPEWRAIDGVADPLPESPVSSDQPEEPVTLVPYAAAKLRITAFPQLKG